MKKRTKLGFAGLLAAGVAALSVSVTGSAVAAQSNEAKAKVGEKAPDFTLTDLQGEKVHTLSEYTKEGKVVVLEWFAPDCPYVIKHYSNTETSTVNTLVNEYKDKDVVFLAINSSAADHPYGKTDRNLERVEEWKINHPLLVDASGVVGKTYGARTTPHMFIIDTDGVLRYAGALDNNSSSRGVGETNYVRQALDEILAGETVTVSETRPYGCGVKYAK
ncbi:MAG: thioredoxin family protein [Phycisphaerales bacterium JB050]